jgi:hypothetical protein
MQWELRNSNLLFIETINKIIKQKNFS